MGIDAQVPALREGPLETVLARALGGAVRGDAMHHAVGLIPNPGSVVNLVVGGFHMRALVKEEDANYAAVVLAHMPLASCYVVLNETLRGPLVGTPLVGVAGLGHEGTRVRVYLHDAIKVLSGCCADVHGVSLCKA